MCPRNDGDACCLSGGVPSLGRLARRRWGYRPRGCEGSEDPGESGLRLGVDRHLVAAVRKPGVPGDERDELARLQRENRVLRMERDLLA